MRAFSILITASAVMAVSYAHISITKTPNELHPVHELYVKPSADGTTGDLYVAATEDSGSKTQWLTDQPVHFLPIQSQPAPTSNLEESLNPKHATASPHVHYTHPVAGKTDANSVASSYPYALPAAKPAPATEAKTEAATTAAAIPQYNPYQFFYPQIMAAYANMMNVLKESGMSEETASSAISHSSPAWPHSYAYPVQYVMVDPNTWAQAQLNAPPTTATTQVAANKE